MAYHFHARHPPPDNETKIALKGNSINGLFCYYGDKFVIKVQWDHMADPLIKDIYMNAYLNHLMSNDPSLRTYEKHFMRLHSYFPGLVEEGFTTKFYRVQSSPQISSSPAQIAPCVVLSRVTKHATLAALVRSIMKAPGNVTIPAISKKFGAFMRALIHVAQRTGFSHHDMHFGNVLYDQTAGCFVLIDYGRVHIPKQPNDPMPGALLANVKDAFANKENNAYLEPFVSEWNDRKVWENMHTMRYAEYAPNPRLLDVFDERIHPMYILNDIGGFLSHALVRMIFGVKFDPATNRDVRDKDYKTYKDAVTKFITYYQGYCSFKDDANMAGFFWDDMIDSIQYYTRIPFLHPTLIGTVWMMQVDAILQRERDRINVKLNKRQRFQNSRGSSSTVASDVTVGDMDFIYHGADFKIINTYVFQKLINNFIELYAWMQPLLQIVTVDGFTRLHATTQQQQRHSSGGAPPQSNAGSLNSLSDSMPDEMIDAGKRRRIEEAMSERWKQVAQMVDPIDSNNKMHFTSLVNDIDERVRAVAAGYRSMSMSSPLPVAAAAAVVASGGNKREKRPRPYVVKTERTTGRTYVNAGGGGHKWYLDEHRGKYRYVPDSQKKALYICCR